MSASKALAEATAHMGRIAAHLGEMSAELAAEAKAYEVVGEQLDVVEARLGALADLADQWEAKAREIERGPRGAPLRVARALRQCSADLRAAVGGT